MKKKFLYSVFAFVVTMFMVVVVHADNDAHVITTPAKAMSFTPDSTPIYAIADDFSFDEYSKKVQFSAKSGSEKITPKSDAGAQKIIIAPTPNLSAAGTLDVTKKATELAGEGWFTAYCLDGGLKLPQFSIFNMNPTLVGGLLTATYTFSFTDEQLAALGLTSNTVPKVDRQIGATTLLAMLGNKDLRALFNNYTGYDQQIDIVYAIEVDGVPREATLSTIDLAIANPAWAQPVASTDWGTTPQEIQAISMKFLGAAGAKMTDLKGLKKIDVLVKSITLHKADGEATIGADKLVAADATGAGVDGYYKMTYDANDILFDKYYVDKNGAKNYKHSLWIIEHSYPSMTIDALLAEVGSTKENLKTQILGLYGSETFTDAEVENLLDNYVYWTVQYAMWKANDSFDDNGKRLGDTLYLGSLAENNDLNKIYQYLIKDRDEYATYGEGNYNTDDITLDVTNNDKVTTTNDYYTYGPYTANYNVIDPSDITIEVTSSNKDGVSIVDKDGNKLTSVKNGQEFYVRCKKSAKVTNVDLKLSASGRSYDDSEKGTIYYANNVMNQNVITGLGYANVEASVTKSLTYNPKTGVPNIAIVFVITLIAFSLGYLALSYNKKSMELN